MEHTVILFFRVGFQIMYWLLIIRVIISWIRPDPYHPVVQFVYKTTEPILEPVRNLIHKYSGAGMMIDFSPLIVIILLQVVQGLVMNILYSIFY